MKVHVLICDSCNGNWNKPLKRHCCCCCCCHLSTGTTTTTESLYMGVPVITLQGNCHAHNVSCSLLAAVGIADQWVAKTPEEYVQLAVARANNITALQELRQRLRPQMLASRMCDARRFVIDLEDTYDQLWGRWLADGGRKKPVRGLQQQQQSVVQLYGNGLQQQQQQQQLSCVGLVDDISESLATPTVAAAADGHVPNATALANGSSRRGSSDQNCGSKKGSSGSRSLAAVGVDNPPAVAAGAAGGGLAAAAVDGGGGGVHKGRRLSCTCDAAATVHAGAVVDTSADC